MILNPSISRRRTWRALPQFEPISAARVGQLCVIASVAGTLFCLAACVIVDRFTL